MMRAIHFSILACFITLCSEVMAMQPSHEMASDNFETHELIHTVRVIIPPGVSEYNHRFATPVGSSPLRLFYIAESSCRRPPAASLIVQTEDNPVWQFTTFINNELHYKGEKLTAIRLQLQNTFWRPITCTFNLFAPKGLDPIYEEILVGAVTIEGGFSPDIKLNFEEGLSIKGFRIDIPEFCEVDVLMAGVTVEGEYLKATLTDAENQIYEIAGGEDVSVDSIQLATNAPINQGCSLPIYVYQKSH